MNPMLFKLKVHQTKCPIRKGQILPLCKDKLKVNTTDSLNNAFVYISSVSKLQSSAKHGRKETYKISMIPVEWDEVKMKWGPVKTGTVSPHPFDISISSEELYDNFGVMSRETSEHVAAQGVFSNYIQSLFRKTKRYNEWMDIYANYDFDKILTSVGNRAISASGAEVPYDMREDLMHDALIKTATEDVLRKFDSTKANLLTYLARVFRFRIIDEVRRYKTQESGIEQAPKDSDVNEERRLEYLNEQTERTVEHAPTEEKVNFKLLIEDFEDFLSSQKRGEILVAILKGTLSGEKLGDIASKLKMHQSQLSRYVKEFKDYLLEYAKESENDLLYGMALEFMRKKTSAESDDYDTLQKLIQEYQKHPSVEAGEEKEKLATRVPVGETITIKRKPIPSLENLTKEVVQDPTISTNQATENVDTYLQDLLNMDELIEDSGKIIGLKVSRK